MTELRTEQVAHAGRIRAVENAVLTMVTEQRTARKEEARQYRRVALSIQWGGLAMAVGLLVLGIITIIYNKG